jgi:hypothetical protein
MRHYLYFNLDQCTIVLGPLLVPQHFLSFALIEDVATGSETFQHVVEWNCKSFEVQSWWCSYVPVVVLITQLVATPGLIYCRIIQVTLHELLRVLLDRSKLTTSYRFYVYIIHTICNRRRGQEERIPHQTL